jgi:hypothetical protein
MRFIPSLSLAGALCLTLTAFAGENTTSCIEPARKTRAPGVRELSALLQQTMDTEGFQGPMSLKEAVSLLQEKLKLRGHELPIHVDVGAFQADNPEAASIYDTQVAFPAAPRQMKVVQVLHFMLSRVEPANAACLIRPGYLEVTTWERAEVGYLLGQAVHVSFERRPLALALEELYQLTGVAVVLDPRALRQAQIPISGNFTNSPSLGSVLLLLSEMAGLKMLVGDNMIYMTTPAHARQLLRERLWIPYHMQAGGPRTIHSVPLSTPPQK